MRAVPSHQELLTTTELRIIRYFLSFRYITVFHLTHLMYYKDKRTAKTFIKQLLNKGYLQKVPLTDEVWYNARNIYCMTTKVREVVKQYKMGSPARLRWVYKEPEHHFAFISQKLFLLEIYIHFRMVAKQDKRNITFLTKDDFSSLEVVKKAQPDALMKLSKDNQSDYAFLFCVDRETPLFAARKRLRQLCDYFEESLWQDEVNKPFPTVYFVCHNMHVKGALTKTMKSELYNRGISFPYRIGITGKVVLDNSDRML